MDPFPLSPHRSGKGHIYLLMPLLFLLLIINFSSSLNPSPVKFQRRKENTPSSTSNFHVNSSSSTSSSSSINQLPTPLPLKNGVICDHPSHNVNRTSRAMSHNNGTSIPSKITSSIVSVTDKFGSVERVTDEELGEPAIPLPCLRVGYSKHPKDCSRFYRCFKLDSNNDHKENSHSNKYQFRCPPGLIFDEVHEICNWPSWSPSCSGSGEIYQVIKKKFTCPSYGYFQDPSDCAYFYYCSNFGKRTLQPYEFKCPFNLAFDEEKLVCNWKWLVKGCKEALNPESAEKTSESNFNAQYLDASGMVDGEGGADQSLDDLGDGSLEKRSDDDGDVEFVDSGSVSGSESVIPAEHRNSEGRKSFARSIKEAVSGAIENVNAKVKSLLGYESPDTMEKRQDFLIDPTLIADESIISNLFQGINPFANTFGNQAQAKKKSSTTNSRNRNRNKKENPNEKFISIPIIEVAENDPAASLPLPRGRRPDGRSNKLTPPEPANLRRHKQTAAPRRPLVNKPQGRSRPMGNRGVSSPTHRPIKQSTSAEMIPVPILTVRETPKPHHNVPLHIQRRPDSVPARAQAVDHRDHNQRAPPQSRRPVAPQQPPRGVKPPVHDRRPPQNHEIHRAPPVNDRRAPPMNDRRAPPVAHRGPPIHEHRPMNVRNEQRLPSRPPLRSNPKPAGDRNHERPVQQRPPLNPHPHHHGPVPQALPSINIPHSREPPPRSQQVAPKLHHPKPPKNGGIDGIQAQLPVELFSNYDVDVKQLDVHPLFTAGGNIDLTQLNFLPSVGEAIHDALQPTKKPFGMPHSGHAHSRRPDERRPQRPLPKERRPVPPTRHSSQPPHRPDQRPHTESSERAPVVRPLVVDIHGPKDQRIPPVVNSAEQAAVERLPVERIPMDHSIFSDVMKMNQEQINAHNEKQLQKLREFERRPEPSEPMHHGPPRQPVTSQPQAHHLHHDSSQSGSYQASGSDNIQSQYQINLLPEKLAPQPDNHYNIPQTTVTKNGFKPISPTGPQYQQLITNPAINNYYQPLSNPNNYQYSQQTYGIRNPVVTSTSTTHSPYSWSATSESTSGPDFGKTSKSSLLIIPIPDDHPKTESLSDVIQMSKDYPHLFPTGFDFNKIASITRSKSMDEVTGSSSSSSSYFNSGFTGYNSQKKNNDSLKSDYIIMTVNEDPSSNTQKHPMSESGSSKAASSHHYVTSPGKTTTAPVVIKLEIPEGKPEVVKTIVEQVKQTLGKVTTSQPKSKYSTSTVSPLHVSITASTLSPSASTEQNIFESNKQIPQSLYDSIQQVITQHLMNQQGAYKVSESSPVPSTSTTPGISDDDISTMTTVIPTIADSVTASSALPSQAILESIPFNYFYNQSAMDPVAGGWPYPQPWFQHPYAPYYPHQPVYGHPSVNQTNQYFPYPSYPSYQPSWPAPSNYSNAFAGWYEWAYGTPSTAQPTAQASTLNQTVVHSTTPSSPITVPSESVSSPGKPISNSFYITVTTTSATPIVTIPTTTPMPPTQWTQPGLPYHRLASTNAPDEGFDLLRTKTTQPDTPQIQVYIVQGPNGPQVQTKTLNSKDGSKQPNVQVYVIDEKHQQSTQQQQQQQQQQKGSNKQYYQYSHDTNINYQVEESRRETTMTPSDNSDLYFKDEVSQYNSPTSSGGHQPPLPSLSTGDIRSQSSQSSKVPSLQSLYNSGHPELKNFTDSAVPESACTRPGLFQHPNDCNKFYECYFDRYTKKYTLHLFECPVKVAFDSRIVGCSGPHDPTVCVQY